MLSVLKVLRLMDPRTKVHGAYQQERIDGILERRNQAAQSLYGKVVLLMCRLDTMYYEGSLTPEENQQRENLFRYLKDRYGRIPVYEDKLAPDYERMLSEDNRDLKKILRSLDDIMSLETTINNRCDRTIYLDRLKRILRNFESAFIRSAFGSFNPQTIRQEITQIVQSNSERGAYDFWFSFPWVEISAAYQKNLLKEYIKQTFSSRSKVNII